MSRRIGMLSLACLVCGGFVWWAVTPHSANGAHKTKAIASVTVPEAPAAKTFPAPPPGRAEGNFDLYQGSKAEQKIRAALTDPKGVDIEFIDTPLKDGIGFLADAHHIKILIDEAALVEEGVSIDHPINRTLSGVTLESALKILLEPLGLDYVIEDEVLKISTKDVVNGKRTTRVYETGYLKQIGVEPEALCKTIEAVVEPKKWNVQALGDMIVVSAPKPVHEQIRGLLIQLDRRWQSEHGKH